MIAYTFTLTPLRAVGVASLTAYSTTCTCTNTATHYTYCVWCTPVRLGGPAVSVVVPVAHFFTFSCIWGQAQSAGCTCFFHLLHHLSFFLSPGLMSLQCLHNRVLYFLSRTHDGRCMCYSPSAWVCISVLSTLISASSSLIVLLLAFMAL